MDQTLRPYATRTVPRYTSYPTAPHFSANVNGEIYAGWLSALPEDATISLYLHVPFCRQLCWYCGCNMKLATRRAPIEAYAQTLKREIELVAARLPARHTITHLHWGGGTPTALSPEELKGVMDTVHAHFDVAEDAELAIESDPRTLTGDMIAMIGALGFTRASFGVQEFDPKVQAAINRVQPPDMVRKSVEGLRAACVSSINFDLIYGLPYQTTETLLETIRLCLEMKPDRIALFGYAHVPWMAKKQRLIDEAALPGAAARLHQALAAADAIKDAGYRAIGLDHFAREDDSMAKAAHAGTLKRNFQGYTTDTATALIGVGATSIGRSPSGFVQNITETGAWARSIEAGTLPIARGHGFTGDDIMRSTVIEALMCQGAVDLDAIAFEFNLSANWYHDVDDELTQMARDGLITRDGGSIVVTKEGVALVRVVASLFDAYLERQNARHSVAV